MTRLAKGSLVYGIGGILQRFMGLMLLPFFTNVLTPEDYGVVAMISIIGIAMGGLFTLGTGNSMGVLYFREKDLSKRPAIIWTNFSLMVVNGLFWYLIIFLFAPFLSDLIFETERYSSLIRLSLLGSVLSTVVDPFLAYLRMEQKAIRYVFVTLTSALSFILISAYLVLILRVGIFGMILAGPVSHGIMLIVIWVVLGRQLRFEIDKTLLKPLIRIGFPSVFGLFAFLLIDYADRQMIEWMLGLSSLGIYSIGYSFGMIITIAVGAFGTAWPPFAASYITRQDEAKEIFSSVLTYYSIGCGILIVLFFCFAKPVLLLATTSEFHEAWTVVGLVAAGYALKGCYIIFLPGISWVEKLHLQSMIEWIAAFVNIVLNIILIPIYGIIGAAIATFVSYLVLTVMACFVSRRYLKVNCHWKRLITISILISVTAFCLFRISLFLEANLFQTIIANICVLLAFLVIIYFLFLNSVERVQIWKKICNR